VEPFQDPAPSISIFFKFLSIKILSTSSALFSSVDSTLLHSSGLYFFFTLTLTDHQCQVKKRHKTYNEEVKLMYCSMRYKIPHQKS